MGKCNMGWLGWHSSIALLLMILAACTAAWAQAPDYNLGRAPTGDEIKAWDISIPPDGRGLPPGSGTAVEGAKLYVQKGCVVCHGPNGTGGLAPHLAVKKDAAAGQAEKVMPIFTGHFALAEQPHIKFVQKSGGLQSVVGPLAAHQTYGDPMEVVVYEWHQALEIHVVAGVPRLQQLRHFTRTFAAHFLLLRPRVLRPPK